MSKGWCLIPPSVFSDSKLADSEKLLFGKLLGLTNKTGFCWASNSYLADMFVVSERSIQRRIGALEKRGYVTIEQNGRRYIRVNIRGDKTDIEGVTELTSDNIVVDFKKEDGGIRLFQDMLCKGVHSYWGELRADSLMKFGVMTRRRIPPLSTARRKAILAAHKSGYTEDEMKTAIKMVLESEFHLENGYTDLTLILRDTKIEQYLSWVHRDEKTITLEPRELV